MSIAASARERGAERAGDERSREEQSDCSIAASARDSCGYAVPNLEYVGDRDVLDRAQERRDDDYYVNYAATVNAASIDGLPALR